MILVGLVFATRTFGMTEEPVQAMAKIGNGKPLISWETMAPPDYREMVHKTFYLGDGCLKIRVT
jgi:hypothetical protein